MLNDVEHQTFCQSIRNLRVYCVVCAIFDAVTPCQKHTGASCDDREKLSARDMLPFYQRTSNRKLTICRRRYGKELLGRSRTFQAKPAKLPRRYSEYSRVTCFLLWRAKTVRTLSNTLPKFKDILLYIDGSNSVKGTQKKYSKCSTRVLYIQLNRYNIGMGGLNCKNGKPINERLNLSNCHFDFR